MSSEDSTNEYQFRQLLESRPDPSTISAEIMAVAEKITWSEVLFRIHPTLDEFEKRAEIILFLQEMVTQSFEGIQAFPYGSVPLKTYLGRGDIDLTVICEPVEKDLLAEGMYALLKYEEQNSNAEYTVKETKLIGAEVKLVRCKIENVPVDISFNQLGGLSTVCFLEKVDHLINKNHLFKRSVLLIKAWCHYECRILGAYHGLLATYALEALILFIFQLFGSSLNGPLAVLYRFLDYYGKFDWDNSCISLDGPVRTSSLPDLVVTDRGNDGAELLFSGENMRFYTDLFAAATSSNGGQDMRIFGPMHLNIIDPIKKNNNLGRSIYKGKMVTSKRLLVFAVKTRIVEIFRGNALRIRAAFNYGARNLGRILQLPSEYISDEIKMFFECTRMWHRGNGVIPESLSPLLLSDEEDFQLKSVEGDTDDADTMSDEEGAWPSSDVSNPLTPRSLNELMDMEAVENSNLVNLSGDYVSLARGLVHGRCTLGYSATIPALSSSPPTMTQFQELLLNSAQWNMFENYAVVGQSVYTENRRLRGTGTYIPLMDSTSFRERSSRRRLENLMREPSRGSQRNRDSHIQTSDTFYPGPSQNDNTQGNDVEGRTPENSINLNSEYDFPPLN